LRLVFTVNVAFDLFGDLARATVRAPIPKSEAKKAKK